MSNTDITKIIVSAVDENDEKTLELINFYNELYREHGSFTERELANEGAKVKRAIQVCRKIALDMEEYLETQQEVTPKRRELLSKCIKELQDIMLYKHMVSIIFLENYLSEKFTFEECDGINAAILERVPASGHNENGDDPNLQNKRRFGNNHTVKAHLKNLWNIDVNGKQRESEYNKLCDLIESVIYKMESLETSADKEGRVKARIQLFALFSDRKKKPIDLFDSPLDEDIFGNQYRNVVKEFIQEVERTAGIDIFINYKDLRSFWKEWYRNFVDDIYAMALNNYSVQTVKDFYSARFELALQELAQGNPIENLFSEVLFNLLKEEMKNDLYCFQYILSHSKIVMQPLDYERQFLFGSWAIITEPCSYETVKLILENYKENVKALIRNNIDIEKVYLQAKKLMEIIIFPRQEKVIFFLFLALMQCCVESDESELKIEHYGMSRGNKTVELGKIIKCPQDNNCKEVRLFLIHLMRLRYFMNLFDEETMDQINAYRIMWDDIIETCIDNMSHWNDVKTDLSNLKTFIKAI